MAKQVVNIGTVADDGTGDTLRAGGDKINDNFNELYVGTETVDATAKTTPVDADVMPIQDSAASNVKKKVTWANIKATLKTYFDTLYVALTGNQTVAGIKTFSSFPVTPSSAPTTNYQVANKKYVDDNAGGDTIDFAIGSMAWDDVSDDVGMYTSMQEAVGFNVPTPVIIIMDRSGQGLAVYANTSATFSGAEQLIDATSNTTDYHVPSIVLVPGMYYGFYTILTSGDMTITIKRADDLTTIDTFTFTYAGGPPM